MSLPTSLEKKREKKEFPSLLMTVNLKGERRNTTTYFIKEEKEGRNRKIEALHSYLFFRERKKKKGSAPVLSYVSTTRERIPPPVSLNGKEEGIKRRRPTTKPHLLLRGKDGVRTLALAQRDA